MTNLEIKESLDDLAAKVATALSALADAGDEPAMDYEGGFTIYLRGIAYDANNLADKLERDWQNREARRGR